jgi:hypothetical protein
MKAPDHYPRSERRYGERPIRLYDSKTKKCIAHRCFKYPVRALNTTAAMMNWISPFRTIEVYNSQTGRLLGAYTKHANGVIETWIDDRIKGGKA